MITTSSILACATCANAFKHGGQDAAGWAIALMLLVIVPPNEESKHKPVNNIDEVIDIAAVIGVILGNPEPF